MDSQSLQTLVSTYGRMLQAQAMTCQAVLVVSHLMMKEILSLVPSLSILFTTTTTVRLGGQNVPTNKMFTGDPLWDGEGCLGNNQCCNEAGMPWFFRQFPQVVTADMLVKICHDWSYTEEGVRIDQLQLYVQ